MTTFELTRGIIIICLVLSPMVVIAYLFLTLSRPKQTGLAKWVADMDDAISNPLAKARDTVLATLAKVVVWSMIACVVGIAIVIAFNAPPVALIVAGFVYVCFVIEGVSK